MVRNTSDHLDLWLALEVADWGWGQSLEIERFTWGIWHLTLGSVSIELNCRTPTWCLHRIGELHSMWKPHVSVLVKCSENIEGRSRNFPLQMGIEFQFCRMKCFGDWLHNNVNVLNIELYSLKKVQMVNFMCILGQFFKMLLVLNKRIKQ